MNRRMLLKLALAIPLLLASGTSFAQSGSEDTTKLKLEESKVNTATVSSPNITIVEGTEKTTINLLISSEHEGQTIESMALMVRVDDPEDTSRVAAPFIVTDQKTPFTSSLWNSHPFALCMVQDQGSWVRIILMPFGQPFGVIKADGQICSLVIDTRKLKAGETYTINTAVQGYSSATTIPEDVDPEQLWYTPVRLTHEPGTITVVAKPNNNFSTVTPGQ